MVASFGPGFNAFGDVDVGWFASKMNNLISSLHIDPATLPILVTNNVYLYEFNDFTQCCVLGFHGAAHVTGAGAGSTDRNAKQGVQAYAYAAYAQPGTWSTSSTPASPNGSDGYYIQDIHTIGHEVSEWADDPFVNNTVNPWLTPTAPQYGCTSLLETGDPVVGIGVLVGANSNFQTAGASADGAWHPEDEVLLPWFARQSPNSTSEPLQNATTGRYTFFGDINPYQGGSSSRRPAAEGSPARCNAAHAGFTITHGDRSSAVRCPAYAHSRPCKALTCLFAARGCSPGTAPGS